jgi:hypothetical protein
MDNLAPRLTWDEIKNMAIYLVEGHYGIYRESSAKQVNDTLKRMGYPGGLSNETFWQMRDEQDNG